VTNEDYIVRRAISGESEAFTMLYDLYFDKIYRYVFFRIRKQAEAEDLTQEVFIKAMKAIGSYKMGKTPFAAWLFRIARNQVIDHVRKVQQYQSTSLDEAATIIGTDDPVSSAETNIEISELNRAIAQLPPAQQEVISLRFIGGLSITEVSQISGKKEGTVKALQFGATASLRKILSGRLEWQSE
jgi:RNA polymerase sigma-70 factor, ECF subfamily